MARNLLTETFLTPYFDRYEPDDARGAIESMPVEYQEMARIDTERATGLDDEGAAMVLGSSVEMAAAVRRFFAETA